MKSVAYVTTTFPTLAVVHRERGAPAARARRARARCSRCARVGRKYQPEHAPLRRHHARGRARRSTRARGAALLGWLVRRPHVLVPEVAAHPVGVARQRSTRWSDTSATCRPRRGSRACVEREGFERVHGAWAHFPGTVAYLAARLTGRRVQHGGARRRRPLPHAGVPRREGARRRRSSTAACAATRRCCARSRGDGARVEWIYHGVDLRALRRRGRARDARAAAARASGRLAAGQGLRRTRSRRSARWRARGAARRGCVLVGRRARARARSTRWRASSGVADQRRVPRRADARRSCCRSTAAPGCWSRRAGCWRTAAATASPTWSSRRWRWACRASARARRASRRRSCRARPARSCEPGDPRRRWPTRSSALLADPAELDRLGERARARVRASLRRRRATSSGCSRCSARPRRGPAAIAACGVTALRVLHVIEAMHQGGAESLVVEHVRHAGARRRAPWCARSTAAARRSRRPAPPGARTLVLDKGGGRAARRSGSARRADARASASTSSTVTTRPARCTRTLAGAARRRAGRRSAPSTASTTRAATPRSIHGCSRPRSRALARPRGVRVRGGAREPRAALRLGGAALRHRG